jgi:hypothetical protein
VNGLLERPGFKSTDWIRFLSPFAANWQTSLITFLTMTKAHRCADARDRIFALIGVSWGLTDSAKSKEVKLSVDYSLTWGQVFRDTIKAICHQSQRLEILSTFQHEPVLPSGGLPSWVGRWVSDPVFVDFARGPFVACGDTIPQLEEHDDKDMLVAKRSHPR